MLKCLKLGVLLNTVHSYQDNFDESYIFNLVDLVTSICPDILENTQIQQEINKINFEEQKSISCDCLIELDNQLNKIDSEEYAELLLFNKELFKILFNDLNTFNKDCLNDKHGLAVLNYFEHLTIIDKFNFSVKNIFKKKNLKCPFND